MYEDYLQRALSNVISTRQALHEYNNSNIKSMKNVAAYHVQQAIELLLKYSIYTI